MPTTQGKAETFNFRVEADLKADFVAATAAEDRPAGQVLRDLMRRYIAARRRGDFEAEARRQSRLIGTDTQEHDEIMHWIDDVTDRDGWR